MDRSSPPSMSIVLLHPVLEEMEAHGCDQATLARQLKIPVDALKNPSTILPAGRVYGFLEWATERTGDLWLCARLGQLMAKEGWAPINQLFRDCGTVWEFFLQFGMVAEDQGGAVSYRLELEGRVALWKLVRRKGSPDTARFADAVAIGLFVEILRLAGRDRFDPTICLSISSSSKLIPPDVLPHQSVITGTKGMTLRFPSEWLNWELADHRRRPDLPELGLPVVGARDLKSTVCHLLEQQISDPGFCIDRIADAVGMPKWKLQRELRGMNTSVAELRSEVRLELASRLLTIGDTNISEIAFSLGYSSPSNFSRAFRAKSGQSPAEFRKSNTTGCLHD
ncbi:helix-turn-helix domain-containing protein [Primorskyibacter sp. S87]|uniref:helix-turn-helix domain-containing protein n=1 Tax=Primorskyibacter sp. S87 TaxID=3415126 RepID=UPI003C7CC6EA